jgi:hypothetical protein
MTDLNRYVQCECCSGWIHPMHTHYVTIEKPDGTMVHVHNRPCRDRYFEDQYGTVVAEHQGVEMKCA